MATLDRHLSQQALSAARQYPPPFYLVDIDRIIDRAVSVSAAWCEVFPRLRLVYPYKANALAAIAANLAQRGMTAEVASGTHLAHALEDGFPPQRTLFGGGAKRNDEIERALRCGVWLSIDSISELRRVNLLAESLQVSPRFLVRLSVLSDGVWSRFGILPEEYSHLLDELGSSRRKLGGFAFHVGSNCWDSCVHANVVRMYAPLIRHQLALQPDQRLIVNVGGGFPSLSGSEDDQVPDAGTFAREVHQAVINSDIDLERIELWIEPGRTLTESFGVMLCNVVATKIRGDRSLVFVDIGSNVLASTPTFRIAEIISDRDERSSSYAKHEIHGNLCVESDVIHKSAQSQGPVRVGDLALISHAGAYDISTASEWMGEMPAILGILRGEIVMLRSRAAPNARRGVQIETTGMVQ